MLAQRLKVVGLHIKILFHVLEMLLSYKGSKVPWLLGILKYFDFERPDVQHYPERKSCSVKVLGYSVM